MTEKTFGANWTRSDLLKSAALFFVHFIVLALIAAVFLLGDKLTDIGAYMSDRGADYLYALFSVLLLTAIMYCYFYFENKEVLSSGKNIALVFTILDVYFIIGWLIGEKIGIYARPVALVALMAFVLIGRREAIFMNIISALLMLVIDTFTGKASTHPYEYYSSLIISFSAGMIAIFFCNRAKTRFKVVVIGILIVIPIDFIIFLLEISTLLNQKVVIDVNASAFQQIIMRMGYGPKPPV